ncbi:hypothetical protein [Caulobacter sp. DWP3-1-3b2]
MMTGLCMPMLTRADNSQLDPRLRIISVREIDPEMGSFITTPGVDCTKSANANILNSQTSLNRSRAMEQIAAYRRLNRSMVLHHPKEFLGICVATNALQDGALK